MARAGRSNDDACLPDLIGAENPQLPNAGRPTIIALMNTIAEIEIAIEHLPVPQVAELAAWLEQFRVRCAMQPPAEAWLERGERRAIRRDDEGRDGTYAW